MNLQPRKESVGYGDGREFLKTTTGLEHKTSGVTLDAAQFEGDVVKGGTAIYRDTSGLFKPVGALDEGPFDGACLTAHSVKRITGQNPIVGAITKCYAHKDRCTGVTDKFAEAVKNRIIFDL